MPNEASTILATASPFLKWPGGKRWLAPALTELFSQRRDHGGALVEPFVGAGAVFFAVQPRYAVLADINAELISTFQSLQCDVGAVVRRIRAMPPPSAAAFSQIVASTPETPASRAARFIYLNRLAFNGIWRVNRLGKFNVPYGHRPPVDLIREAELHSCAYRLQGVTLKTADFRTTLRNVSARDTVYCDPPYTVTHDNNGFIRYNEKLFGWADQRALAAGLADLVESGVRVAVSNAAHRDVLALYPRQHFHAVRLTRVSRVASASVHRRRQAEMLFVSTTWNRSGRSTTRILRRTTAASVQVELLA